MRKLVERGNAMRKYTAVVAQRSTGEYTAIVPAFWNGFEYARTYTYDFGELKALLKDLVDQEIFHIMVRGDGKLPANIPSKNNLEQYLPYDELEDGESYTEPFTMTVLVRHF
jgi:hypothetical protein